MFSRDLYCQCRVACEITFGSISDRGQALSLVGALTTQLCLIETGDRCPDRCCYMHRAGIVLEANLRTDADVLAIAKTS